MAASLNSQGNYAEAEILFKRALAIWERALGPENRDVSTVLVNLGTLQELKGNYPAAEPLLRRALTIREAIFGPQHLELAPVLAISPHSTRFNTILPGPNCFTNAQ